MCSKWDWMTTKRNLRKLDRIEYKIFHETGEKVKKMSFDKEILFEAKVAEDIKDFYKMYELNELVYEDEISEALEMALFYCKNYRDIHTELRLGLKEGHAERYPEYEDEMNKLREYTKEAKIRRREAKEKIEAGKREEERLEKGSEKEEKKLALKCEHDFFLAKLEKKFTSYDWSILSDYNNVYSGVNMFETYINEWYSLNGKLKGLFGEDAYLEKFQPMFDHLVERINKQIEGGKLKLKEILSIQEESTRKNEEDRARAECENKKIQEEKSCEKEMQLNSERKMSAKNLYDEIKVLAVNLSSRCEIDVSDITDYQILDLKKNVFNFTSELREILDKITSFSKLVPYCGKEEVKMMEELTDCRNNVAADVTKFSNDLGKLMRDRDISEEKLKSALSLKIELPKFSGYDSTIDIYSFRTEFEKLIQPAVRRQLWPDYLKRNYLTGNAFTVVEKLEKMEDIWDKLISSYGNMRVLLQNKICALERQNPLWKVTGDEKIGLAIAMLLNMISDVFSLAKKFHLEDELLYGGCFEIILTLLGNSRERKFVSKCRNPAAKKPEEWDRLIEFLKKEMEMRERLTLLYKSKKCLGVESKRESKELRKNAGRANTTKVEKYNCHICGLDGHAIVINCKGRQVIPYFACKKFVEMTAEDRRKVIFDKRLCAQCLEPGVKFDEEHECSKQYVCPDKFHKTYKTGLHVLLCSHHKDSKDNLELLEKFKSDVIHKVKNLEDFSKKISICYSQSVGTIHITEKKDVPNLGNSKTEPDVRDNAIFMLQTINIEGKKFNLFFDSGCGDMVIKKSAVDCLIELGRAKLEVPGPITLFGVGDQKSICEHGAYSVRLPISNGREVILSGLCLDKVTSEFPRYFLKKVTDGMKTLCKGQGGEDLRKRFPKMPKEVGGETDILIGIQYNKYFPELIHRFPSGLEVLKSIFVSDDGSRGVYGGPHPEFTKAEKKHRGIHAGKCAYILPCTEAYRSNFFLECSIPSPVDKRGDLDCDSDMPFENDPLSKNVYFRRRPPKCIRFFDEIENAGTEISYRCVGCRDCPECKKCPRFDSLSIQEEVEQTLVDRSVNVDIENGVTVSELPFLVSNPDHRLGKSDKMAMSVYKRETKKLAQRPNDKLAVIKSENKLQKLGFVDYVDDLTEEQKGLIEGKFQNYIPWRVAWNENSLSTSCRLVFDASQSTPGGCSLNSLLAKGINSMNSLLAIVIRWTIYPCAFHCDIKSFYNCVSLKSVFWRYQLYYWLDNLDVERPPRRKVIKTLIYGVRPSGSLAEKGLRLTAEKTKRLYPRAHDVIMNDIYVDDCLSGECSDDERLSTTDELKLALEKGGFSLKGYTFSGYDPPEHLSEDGESVTVGGLNGFQKRI